jgi:acyl dehydratase
MKGVLMPNTDTARFEPLMTTERQRGYTRDFLETWEQNEFWDSLAIGEVREAPGRFVVAEEDVLAYNRSIGETHPLYVDPDYARAHAPRGTVLVHPVFATTVIFWFSQPGAQGSWIRTPGARNPYQRIEVRDRLLVGDRLTMLQDNSERFWRRGKAYITSHASINDHTGRQKVEMWGTLILPVSHDDVSKFAHA